MIHEVRVARAVGQDSRGADLLREIQTVLGLDVSNVSIRKVYRLQGLDRRQVIELLTGTLCDPITEVCSLSDVLEHPGTCFEVMYKPGVMNPEAASILKVACECGMSNLRAADSSWEYQFDDTVTMADVAQIIRYLLVNKTVQRVVVKDPQTRDQLRHFLADWTVKVEDLVTAPPQTLVISGQAGSVETIALGMLTEDQLLKLSGDRSLFLNAEEMSVIQRYFREQGREPTDVELETLAQTWSEHCGHKTFKARLIVDGQEKAPLITRLMENAKKYGRGVLSSFVDNSGVIDFYDGFGVCGKVETHNSPSAIEPYGGAMTGSGGVFRDIMGTGQGAKVIASTDMFCFAPPDLPAKELPPGCLHPRYLLQKVVAGVRDYGNRMGIPTNNGSIHFHPDFRAKPSVIVGSYGILPVDKCQKGEPEPGDVVIAVGGRTGRDGIHGATFSSGEMTAQTISVNASAVQIGHAIEEKRMADALLACRDENLVKAITDCGAGGFASAIGEMGSKRGVRVELEKAPLKYQGLAPWEIWLSESQERMVIAVEPEHVVRVLAICHDHNVEATVLGVFTDDQHLTVMYNGEAVCNLAMEFLHHGLPQRVMVASKRPVDTLRPLDIAMPTTPEAWATCYEQVMSHGNVCSKEPIVRMYDHTVQGTNALPPFSGLKHNGPNDAVVIRPLLDKPYGLVVSHGLNPVLNTIDPYAGSIWAATEALSNLAAVGGNIRDAALIDNFICPYPDGESLWDLDQMVEGCLKIMEVFGIPFVSGKDSLSSTYRRGDFVLKIPPVLCVSAFGKIPDVRCTVTSDFKQACSHIILVGELDTECLGGSVYADTCGQLGNRVPHIALDQLPNVFGWLYRQIHAGHVLACHDISDGGLAAAVAEMCFGGTLGASLSLPESRADFFLFSETAGCFVLEVEERHVDWLVASARRFDLPVEVIGRVEQSPDISVSRGHVPLFSLPCSRLFDAWQRPMKEVFHS